MAQLLLLLTGALVVGAIVFGVTVLITGGDGLGEVEPDGRSVPLPSVRPLIEEDVTAVRFDTTVRGYRMDQVDEALRRAAYDIGYKDELIQVLEAEVVALRDGRTVDADALRDARTSAATGAAAEQSGADLGLLVAGSDAADQADTVQADTVQADPDPADPDPADPDPADPDQAKADQAKADTAKSDAAVATT